MSEELGRPDGLAARQAEAREFIMGIEPSEGTELEPVVQHVRPARRRLASEEIVVSAPMSFHGSASRIWKITRASDNDLAIIALSALAFVLIGCAWVVVLCWYVIFGLFLVPYRLVRRGQRKRKLDAARHREMMAATSSGHPRIGRD